MSKVWVVVAVDYDNIKETSVFAEEADARQYLQQLQTYYNAEIFCAEILDTESAKPFLADAMPDNRNCENCKKLFFAERKNRRYCSDECRKKTEAKTNANAS